MTMTARRYPIGIQTFSRIIREGYIYIDNKDYALPYQTEGMKVVKIGVKFDSETRIPEEWVIGCREITI